MTKTATRDANTIKRLAEELLDVMPSDTITYAVERIKLKQIIELARGIDASTGRRDSSLIPPVRPLTGCFPGIVVFA